MAFPNTRPRRTRQSDPWRRLVRETHLRPEGLVYPLFAVPGRAVRRAVESMPGIFQLSVDEAARHAREVAATGVPAVLVFAAPDHKDPQASSALDPKGLAGQTIGAIKEACPQLLVWADVCLCGATDHGHCGHITQDGAVDNDSSVRTLAEVALNYARAGADAVAPSDMMDGRVAAIRALLDASGKATTPIVAYAAKYASAFYGPFREAAESAPAFGDRRSYQMDPANSREALREVLLDVEEAPTWSWSSPPGPTLMSSARCATACACRWWPTRSPESSASSRWRPPAAGSTARRGAGDPHRDPPCRGRPHHQLLRARSGAVAERMSTPGVAPRAAGAFLAACRRQPVAHRPIWIMRQAGRYLPEYRALRAKVDFETLTRTADLAAEVTLQPLRRFELDAAILFSDIMTPLQGMGVDLAFEPGPVVRAPIRSDAQIDALPALVPERGVPFVLEAIRLVSANLPRGVPLIGFAGAPFTLLCYLVGGRPSKEFGAARAFLYAQPESAQRLLTHTWRTPWRNTSHRPGGGRRPGADAVESWAGLLGPPEFARFALAAVRAPPRACGTPACPSSTTSTRVHR
jgi:porphobilinogen synthase